MRIASLENDHFYHVYNRGVDRRDVFLSDQDRRRFLRACILLNNDLVSSKRYELNKDGHHPLPAYRPLVSIICYVLMNNHVHFLLRQNVDDGIARFMQRLGTSYTKYFNLRHHRTGSLFESSYKSVLVENTEQFLHLTRYIHLNPLDLFRQDIDQWAEVRRYRWSSLRHYLRDTSDPIVDDSELKSMVSSEEYREFVKGWIPERNAIKNENITEA